MLSIGPSALYGKGQNYIIFQFIRYFAFFLSLIRSGQVYMKLYSYDFLWTGRSGRAFCITSKLFFFVTLPLVIRSSCLNFNAAADSIAFLICFAGVQYPLNIHFKAMTKQLVDCMRNEARGTRRGMEYCRCQMGQYFCCKSTCHITAKPRWLNSSDEPQCCSSSSNSRKERTFTLL